MKTMNFLLAVALIFTVGSCSKETPVQDVENEELAAVEYRSRRDQEKKKPQQVFELDLHQYFLLNKLAELDFEQEKLETQIDLGRKNLIPELEFNTKEIGRTNDVMDFLRKLMCHRLGLYADELAERASKLTKDGAEAAAELDKLEERLKECNIGVSYTTQPDVVCKDCRVIPKTITKGACEPKPEAYSACDLPLPAGEMIFLANERLNQLIITDKRGEIVSKAKLLGTVEGMNSFYRYSIEIPFASGDKLSMRVSKENIEYSVAITSSEELR